MPRDIPLGNGSLLVAFDNQYCIRDLYWPHVGQKNHAAGHPFRIGVWVDGTFCWLNDTRWMRQIQYDHETLVSAVRLSHPDLKITISANDAVDFHLDLLVRRWDIRNDSSSEKVIRLFFHHDFHIDGNEVGDTAYYEPDRRAIIHYKDKSWFLINGAQVMVAGDQGPGWAASPDTATGIIVGVHQWACGLKEIRTLEGTWRDAEDGQLSGNPVAHGSVDSTIGFNIHIPKQETRTIYYWLAVAPDFESVVKINRIVRQRGPQQWIERTTAYWRLWLNTHKPDFGDLPVEICQAYNRSLLVIRTQVDSGGAILAANDSDVSSTVRDTYSYMWPRDGALVAHALTKAGYLDIPRSFFEFCSRILTREGFLLHKYNPDGTLASSWHPWYRDGHKDIPIQEDETALPLWALWEHFAHFGDVSFIKPYYRAMICPIADFLTDHRDQETGLPLPTYDLWEERQGILSWTVGSVWAGLTAGANFCQAFGEMERAQKYQQAAEEIKEAVEKYLWMPQQNRFARMINLAKDGSWLVDDTIDASISGLWLFGMISIDDPHIIATMKSIEDRLWVKTTVGGIARFENDAYHQVSQDIQNIPGNPWFICTLWLAEYYARKAKKMDDLKFSLNLLNWVTTHALPSGIMAEQVNPYDDTPLSVSPLTWSHAAFVDVVQTYLHVVQKLKSDQELNK